MLIPKLLCTWASLLKFPHLLTTFRINRSRFSGCAPGVAASSPRNSFEIHIFNSHSRPATSYWDHDLVPVFPNSKLFKLPTALRTNLNSSAWHSQDGQPQSSLTSWLILLKLHWLFVCFYQAPACQKINVQSVPSTWKLSLSLICLEIHLLYVCPAPLPRKGIQWPAWPDKISSFQALLTTITSVLPVHGGFTCVYAMRLITPITLCFWEDKNKVCACASFITVSLTQATESGSLQTCGERLEKWKKLTSKIYFPF